MLDKYKIYLLYSRFYRMQETVQKLEGFPNMTQSSVQLKILSYTQKKKQYQTYQIGYIGHLYGIVDDFGPGAAIAFVEHRFIDDNGGFDVFGGLAYITLEAARAVWIGIIHQAG